jgi:hypothetical protein
LLLLLLLCSLSFYEESITPLALLAFDFALVGDKGGDLFLITNLDNSMKEGRSDS